MCTGSYFFVGVILGFILCSSIVSVVLLSFALKSLQDVKELMDEME